MTKTVKCDRSGGEWEKGSGSTGAGLTRSHFSVSFFGSDEREIAIFYTERIQILIGVVSSGNEMKRQGGTDANLTLVTYYEYYMLLRVV